MKRMGYARAKLNKKVLTLCGVAVLLVGAVVTNMLVNRGKGETPDAQSASADGVGAVIETSVQGGFFESFRLERNTTREQEIAYIDTIIEQGADAETMADAQQQKLYIVSCMEKEMTVESLLKAKGFSDAAVTLHDGSVNVVLLCETLSDEQVAQVLDIIQRETGEAAENVKITTAQ